MMPGKWWRSLAWGGCTLALLSCGCAHWGWKHASRDNLHETLEDDDASFVATSKPRPANTTKATAVNDTKSAGTKPAPARSAEEEALIDDTLARMRTLPNIKPEQVDAMARLMRDPNQPMPRMALEQMNALAKFQQGEAKRQALASAARATEAAPPATTTPAAAAEATAASTPAQPPVAKATATATKPAPVARAIAEAEEPTEPVEQAVYEEEVVEEEAAAPVTPPSRRLLDRVRRARDTGEAPAEKPIFGGKVGAHEAPRLEPEMLAVAHVTKKPATELASVEVADEAPVAWDKSLATTIAALEGQLESEDLAAEDAERLAQKLRMLYLAAERKEDALREIEGLDAHAQDYWRSQMHSLSLSIATDGTPVKGRRASLALRPLREAVDHLAAQATLDVKNVAFCKDVTVWGTYTPFEDYTFKPNQEVLLYFELENFTSAESAAGYSTEFISSYEVFDTAGRRVAEQQFPTAQETCKNRRRDYFIRYHLHMPKTLAAGDYTLQLTVEDQKGHKFGQGSVKFKVSG